MYIFSFIIVEESVISGEVVKVITLAAKDIRELCGKLGENGDSLFKTYLDHSFEGLEKMRTLIPELDERADDLVSSTESMKKYSLECAKNSKNAVEFLELFNTYVWNSNVKRFTKTMTIRITSLY